MAYNKHYQTRFSGRYNQPGQFVPAGEQAFVQTPPPPPKQQLQMPNTNLQAIQTNDVEMKVEAPNPAGKQEEMRPLWMKSKLPGVRKVSNKERRRRQNETLRRLLTPKNALMVLNEMMPNEQVANQFKVEVATNNQYYKPQSQHSFCADLNLDGNSYKGYGENKLMARNAAAEQAIRDYIIKKMHRFTGSDVMCLYTVRVRVRVRVRSGLDGERRRRGGLAAHDPARVVRAAQAVRRVGVRGPQGAAAQADRAGGGGAGAQGEGAAGGRGRHAPLHAAHVHAAAAGVPRAGRGGRPPAEHALHHGRRRRRDLLHRQGIQQERGSQAGGRRRVPGAVRGRVQAARPRPRPRPRPRRRPRPCRRRQVGRRARHTDRCAAAHSPEDSILF